MKTGKTGEDGRRRAKTGEDGRRRAKTAKTAKTARGAGPIGIFAKFKTGGVAFILLQSDIQANGKSGRLGHGQHGQQGSTASTSSTGPIDRYPGNVVGSTSSTSSEAPSLPRSMLYHGTAHSGVSGATSNRPTGSHLIRITQGSILGLLGVPARRRDDVGSRPTATGDRPDVPACHTTLGGITDANHWAAGASWI